MSNYSAAFARALTLVLAMGVVTLHAQAQIPTPFIDRLSPTAAAPGTGQDLPLVINGTGFAADATVNFNGTSLTPSSVTSTQINVTVPGTSLAAATTAKVTVVNPNTPPLEGISNVVFLPITNATPSVSTLPQTLFGVGGIPTSVAVGDFNGDGKLDLATANLGSSTVTILLGDGTGKFTPTASSPGVGAFPVSMAVGDFNGDGKLDLVSANLVDIIGSVTILLGDGTGNFTAVSSRTVGGNPSSVAVGDFNGDGKLDLAVSNESDSTVTILLGDGTGNFTTASSPAVGNTPTGVAVGDFNGDGKLDLATANFTDNNVTILLGDGTGNFSTASSPGVGAGPFSVAVGDFNGDGKLDLVVANKSSNNVTILLGDGTGNFSPTASSPTRVSNAISVAVGDFNGDGKLDLGVSNFNDNAVIILLGDGTGNLTAVSFPKVDIFPRNVAVGDFNGDGRLDLVTANERFSTVSILLQPPAPEPGVPATLAFGNQNVGASVTLPLTITNSGTAALNITAVSVNTGIHSADFTVAPNTCSVNPGGNCMVNVTFTPSMVGHETATLSVTDNAGSGTQTVSLSGTGVQVGPVVIDGCNSGVTNAVLPSGRTISDLIAECAKDASNHGQFVSCVAYVTNDLSETRTISGQQKGAIQSCAAQAHIP